VGVPKRSASRHGLRHWQPIPTPSSPSRFAEHYPAIVAAGAGALGNIDNLVVLNGAEGMEDLLGKALTMGGAGLGLARSLMSSIRGSSSDGHVEPPAVGPANGKVPAAVPAAAGAPAHDSTG
jgi:hypothetical protein